jgi:hypothetical protein
MNNTLPKYLVLDDVDTDDDNSPVTDFIFKYEVGILGKELDSAKKYNKKYTPTHGDILYFSPECTVPRFKLKNFCEKYNCSISKTPDKATVIVVSDEDFRKQFRMSYYNIITKECLKAMIEKSSLDQEKTLEYYKLIDEFSTDEVLVDCTHTIRDHQILDPIVKKFCGDALEYSGSEDFHRLLDNADLRYNIINDPRIYFQKQIVKFLNEENVMDEDSYKTTKVLLESPDNSNHMLALEVMANCDYTKSAPYLLLLFEQYSGTISNCPSKNHVNFKSFLKFFNLNLHRRYDLDSIIYTLKKAKLATIENIEIVLRYKTNDLLSSSSEDYFEVSTVKPNSKCKEAIYESLIEQAEENNVEYSKEEIYEAINNLEFKIEHDAESE